MRKRNAAGLSFGSGETILDQPEISPVCLWLDGLVFLLAVISLCLSFNLSVLRGFFDMFGLSVVYDAINEIAIEFLRDVMSIAGMSAPDNPWFMAAAIFAVFVTGRFIVDAASWQESRVMLTNLRLIYKTGVITKSVLEIRCAQVESVLVEQNIIERATGTGTIEISGTGSGGFEIPFLKNPLDFKEILNDAVSRARAAYA